MQGGQEGRNEGGSAPVLWIQKARPRSHSARAGTGAGLLVLPRPGLHLYLCQVGMPLCVGEASRADVPASSHPAPTRCTVLWAQRGTVTSRGFRPVLRAFWAAWQADSRLPVYSPTLALQGERFSFLWVQQILATALSHQTPCGFSQA